MKENKRDSVQDNNNTDSPNIEKLKEKLTQEQYQVCTRKGTELPFIGKYWDCKQDGLYHCVCCGNELFDSETKFESVTGWPSFWAPAKMQNLKLVLDKTHGTRKIEFDVTTAKHILAMSLTMVLVQ